MAADVIDAASQHLLHVVPESCTSEIALVGADGYQALINRAQDLADEHGVMIEDIIHLLNRYGNLISEVLEPLILDESWKERLLDSLPYLRAEIRYAVSHERALTIADVLMRRTRIALESADRGRAAVPLVAEIMARVLMWDDARREEEIANYLSEIDRAIAAETELVQSGIQGSSSR
jgi:glycerol-3-phosphate dehydrogenase